MTSIDAILDKISRYSARFYERGWVWGTAGNFSARYKNDPLEFAITASGIQKGELTREDFLFMKEGKVTRGLAHLKPSDETPIHEAIYRAIPDAQVILHSHPMYATLLSRQYGKSDEVSRFQLPWQEMLKGIGVMEGTMADLLVFPNWQDTKRVGELFETTVQISPTPIRPVMFLYEHGITTWGKTPEEALRHMEVMEYVCEYNYLKR